MVHEHPGLARLTIPKFRLTSPTRHRFMVRFVPVGPTCHAIPPQGSAPKFPNSQAASPHGSCRPHRAPASPPFPPAAAPHGLQNPPPLLHSPARHLSRARETSRLLPSARAVEPAIPWISGRLVPGTMSGGEEDQEGLGESSIGQASSQL